MKASELRIGNYYKSVKFNTPVVCEASDIVQIYHNADGAKIDEDYIAMVFKPISITQEWLIKFGCIEQIIDGAKKNYWNKSMDFSVDVEYTFNHNNELLFYYLVHNQERRRLILYVHELQNIYFCLTGEELKIHQDKTI